MPTFIARFRRNLPSNFTEWVLSIGVLALGMMWLVFPNSFNRQDMAEFTDIMSPRLWTTTAIMIGIVSCIAIAASTEAPRLAGTVRFFANLARLMLFGAFLGRAIAASEFSAGSAAFGLVVWTVLMVLDIQCISRNSANTLNAFRKVHNVRPASMVR